MPTGVYIRNSAAPKPQPASPQANKRERPTGTKAKPVGFRIVANPLAEDAYKKPERKKQVPFYQQALMDLAQAKRGSVLCFDETRCLQQLRSAAKKMGWTILVAEDAGKLFVQVVDTGDDK